MSSNKKTIHYVNIVIKYRKMFLKRSDYSQISLRDSYCILQSTQTNDLSSIQLAFRYVFRTNHHKKPQNSYTYSHYFYIGYLPWSQLSTRFQPTRLSIIVQPPDNFTLDFYTCIHWNSILFQIRTVNIIRTVCMFFFSPHVLVAPVRALSYKE